MAQRRKRISGPAQSAVSAEPAKPTTMLGALQDFALFELEQGRFEEALRWTERALLHIENLDQPMVHANCLELASFLLGELGRYDEAIHKAEQALSICLGLGELRLAADCESILAHHLHGSGRDDEAAERLRLSELRYLEIGELKRAEQCQWTANMWTEGKEVGLRVGN